MNHPIFQRLQTFSDPNRIRLLRILQHGEFSVGELTVVLETPQSTISRHLKLLLEQSLIQRRTEGTASYYQSSLELRSSHDQQLYRIILEEYKDHEAEDMRRAQSVLALRTVNAKNFFKQIGSRWHNLRHDLFGNQYLLPTLLHLLPPETVVADIGCGSGEVLKLLAPSIQKIIGIDQSEDMLKLAKISCLSHSNVVIRSGSVENLPLKNEEVQLVLCMLLLHHVSDLARAFEEISRALSQNGRLIILDIQPHNRSEFKQRMGHKHLGISKDLINDTSSKYFVIDHYTNLDADPSAIGPPLFLSVLRKM
jgi:SAM-dependent methyltransferase